jgi:Domain of unknown function (DUF4280)
MGQPWVTSTAQILCTFGLSPSVLEVLPLKRVLVEGKPAATITDMVPFLNIPPFGMCSSLANPVVAAATAAALGVLTPMPCIPAPVGPWDPGAAQTVAGAIPALTEGAQCHCAWEGVISIIFPGSVKTLDA